MTPDRFMARQIRRRNAGKVVPPVVGAGIRWRPYPITTPYRKPGPLTQWSLGYHTGEDHACPEGSRAIAVSWGEVVCVAVWSRFAPMRTLLGSTVAHWGEPYGTHVVIRQGNGLHDYAYCHLRSTWVRPGDKIVPGQVIGLTGRTGGSGTFGPHLHLEARPAGGRFGSDVDPIRVKRKGRG